MVIVTTGRHRNPHLELDACSKGISGDKREIIRWMRDKGGTNCAKAGLSRLDNYGSPVSSPYTYMSNCHAITRKREVLSMADSAELAIVSLRCENKVDAPHTEV